MNYLKSILTTITICLCILITNLMLGGIFSSVITSIQKHPLVIKTIVIKEVQKNEISNTNNKNTFCIGEKVSPIGLPPSFPHYGKTATVSQIYDDGTYNVEYPDGTYGQGSFTDYAIVKNNCD